MIKVNVGTRDGNFLTISWDDDLNLMEAIRAAGITELQGLCGGQVSCATCHVHIDPAYAGYMQPMSEHEDDLLDSSDYRKLESRLSCQIPCTLELDGMSIKISPEN